MEPSWTAEHSTLTSVTGFDGEQSTSKLAEAFRGSDCAVLVTPHDISRGFSQDARISMNMMSAAAEAGVKHIVNIGSWTVNDPQSVSMLADRFVLPEAKLRELAHKNAGFSWTSIRAGFFMGNFINLFSSIRESDTIKFPNECVFAPVDVRDVGAAAAGVAGAVVDGGARIHDTKCYEVSGPERLSIDEMTSKFSNGLGRDIKAVHVSAEVNILY